MCDIIPKTSENCAPPNGAPGVVCKRYVDLCYPLFALAGVYKRGADTNCPKRQSALNYKSLQTALCARCGVMRRHLSRFSPVWGQRVWKTLRATLAESSQEKMENEYLHLCCSPCQDSVRCWRSWTFNAFVDITALWLFWSSSSFFSFLFFSSKRQTRACRTLGTQILHLFAPRLCAGDADVFIGLPLSRRWWNSLGFPTWKRSIQLISACNCTPWGAVALGPLSSTPTFGL